MSHIHFCKHCGKLVVKMKPGYIKNTTRWTHAVNGKTHRYCKMTVAEPLRNL